MKTCPHCHEEVEDNFDICWNCNYCFSEGKVVELRTEGPEDLVMDCLRCGKRMQYAGQYRFHEGGHLGALGNLFELLENRETFDLYCCPGCGKVEFFVPKRPKSFLGG